MNGIELFEAVRAGQISLMDVDELLNRYQLRGGFALWNPRIQIWPNCVVLQVEVPDRNDADRTVFIEFTEEFIACDHDLDEVVARCVLRAVAHEARESLVVDGRRHVELHEAQEAIMIDERRQP